jgi:hypothetical protein
MSDPASVHGARRRRQTTVLVALLVAGFATWWAAAELGRSGTPSPIGFTLQGNVATTLDPANLAAEAALERRIAALRGVASVLGPASMIEQRAAQTNVAIAHYVAAMAPAGPAARRKDLATVLVHYGYIGLPSLANQSFVGQLIFGSGTAPARRFAAVFPDGDHARVTVGLDRGVSDGRAQALRAQIERLVAGARLQGVKASG